MRTRIPYPALAIIVLILVASNVGLLLCLLAPAKEPMLTVSFLNVGQGDAILIEGPTGIEMLIDGGKDRSVVRELPRVMGPLDRSIDILVATHPDADHIGGLPDVLRLYQVSQIMLSGREAESSYVDRFEDAIENEGGARVVEVREGLRIHLGGGAYADVLHPENNVAQLRETNDASVSMRVVYGETAFMLTGDAGTWIEERLVTQYGNELKSDVLKAGHHGSKTSTGDTFLMSVDPSVVVISAGKDNSYGHPHPEVVENIYESGATAVSTAEEGTITFVSNGLLVERR